MKKHSRGQNSIDEARGFSRRHFVKMAGITALGVSSFGLSDFYTKRVSIISDPEDRIAGSPSAQWASKELENSLTCRGISVFRYKNLSQAGTGDFSIVVSGMDSSIARRLLKAGKTNIPAVPEALGLVPVNLAGKQVLLTCGYDVRGLIYAILELADRVQNSTQPLDSLNIRKPVVEVPSNVIRSLNRLFVSEIEDKPWFHDREMWPQYLTMLATHRFNRFNLSLGIGYDFLQNVTDGYFLFAYPFLLNVPGYNVRVPQLPDSEREKNLEMIRFISAQTVARGLQFQLGIWMHGYEWIKSPDANYTI